MPDDEAPAVTATFAATVVPAGNATGVEVPTEVVDALGAGRRPQVVITINGHSWRSRVAAKNGTLLIGISAANRAAAGIVLDDLVEVTLALDTEPRVVELPPDLADALDAQPLIRAAFERLPHGLRRKHVTHIEDAKAAETRQRRITRLVATLQDP